ncbi:MAG: hypothetical protein IJO76_08125, partial [Clostridia bacterium]|nr:hypothetical protein [Clostridia bacterium]
MRKRILAILSACVMLFTCIFAALPVAADASYAYEIVQDYEGANPNGAYWGHANLVDGGVADAQTKDPDVAQAALSGLGSFSTQLTCIGTSGADHLVADAATMQHDLSNPTGIFFRMKSSRTAVTTMYVSTCGAASTDVVWGGNNNAQFALMNWSYNNACVNARYYALDGTNKTVSGDGRLVPANFDGYVFIPCDLSGKSLEGLTIMYAQNWAVGGYDFLSQWWGDPTQTVVTYDNVGFYTAASAEECIAIMNEVEGSYKSYAVDQFQAYETAEQQANAAAVGAKVNSGDGDLITNRYVTDGQLSGTTSRELYYYGATGRVGADYPVMNAPASKLGKTTGIYVRIKTNTVVKTPFLILPTDDKEGALNWPNNFGPKATKYYNLNGELVSTSTYILPAGFDGYAFIPCGDVQGKAIAAHLLPYWFANAYAAAELDGTGHWWVAGPDGTAPTILLDNIGYYAVVSDADYAAVVSDLVANNPVIEPQVEFDVFQTYESAEERANAGANGENIAIPDGGNGITNKYATAGMLNGAYSRELYWVAFNNGADYLVKSAPASKLEKTTGIFFRMNTTTVVDTSFKALAIADADADDDNKIDGWSDSSIAAKFYNLDGELVATSNNILPAGFNGYVFIPTGDVAGQEIVAMLLPNWFGNAYTSGANCGHWWAAGPDGSIPIVRFDDIGYYYAPKGSDANYADLVANLEAEVVAHSHEWVGATCQAPMTCSACGLTSGQPLKHEYDNECDVDCNLCGEAREVEHNVIAVEAKDATCYENGNIAYWYCDVCGQAWLDEACMLNTNLMSVVTPAAHPEATHVEAKAATCYEDGNIEYWYCEACGQAWLDEACT